LRAGTGKRPLILQPVELQPLVSVNSKNFLLLGAEARDSVGDRASHAAFGTFVTWTAQTFLMHFIPLPFCFFYIIIHVCVTFGVLLPDQAEAGAAHGLYSASPKPPIAKRLCSPQKGGT
jgi:hypothetical protein